MALNARRSHWFRSCLVFFLLAVLPSKNLYGGGGWVRPAHKFYAELAFGYYQSGDFFNRNGERRNLRISKDPSNPAAIFMGLENSTFRQFDSGFYLEYGIGHNLEFSMYFALQVVAQQDSDIGKFQVNGISDSMFGIKYQWLRVSSLVSAIQINVGVPVGDAAALGMANGQAPQPIPLGDNEWDFALQLHLSKSFYPTPAYVSMAGGYRYRTSGSQGADFADDFPLSIEAGYTIQLNEGPRFSSLTTKVALRALISTEEREAFGFGTIDVTGFSSQQDALDIEAGFSLGLVREIAFLSSFMYNLAGQNTGAGWGVRFGVSLAK